MSERATVEATQITLGKGLVDVGPILWDGRRGILLRPRPHHLPINDAGELQNVEYLPVEGDVVIWLDGLEAGWTRLQVTRPDFDFGRYPTTAHAIARIAELEAAVAAGRVEERERSAAKIDDMIAEREKVRRDLRGHDRVRYGAAGAIDALQKLAAALRAPQEDA